MLVSTHMYRLVAICWYARVYTYVQIVAICWYARVYRYVQISSYLLVCSCLQISSYLLVCTLTAHRIAAGVGV